jgi:hypothetical protein
VIGRTSNKSLDASGGGVFRNLLGAANGALNRAAASTQPFDIILCNLEMAKRLIVVGCVLVALALGCVLALYLSAEASPVSLTVASPDKTYRVDLNEHSDTYKHWAPIRLRLDSRQFNDVRFSAFKGDSKLAVDERLWDDSSDDSRFFDSYKYQWVNNSVLRFGLERSFPASQLDEVTVFNDSSRVVGELRLESRDIFLILDLQPNQTMKLTASPQSWLSWLSCVGKFASGQSIPFHGANFPLHDNDETHAAQHYCVAITDAGVTIQNPSVEGNWDENGNRVTVAKGTCDATALKSQR